MPNNCDCELQVIGTLADVQKFIADVKGTRTTTNGEEEKALDFNKLVPYPQEYLDADKVFQAWYKLPFEEQKKVPQPDNAYDRAGYHWCIENWGTKWNAYYDTEWEFLAEDEDFTVAQLDFQTAWSPPLPIIDAMIDKYPELKFEFRYYEQGMQFQGIKNNDEHVQLTYFGNRGG
jgi:hypothetical protein